MIPNVVEGGDPAGLMRYLLGPGRANEHRDPHLVAGDELLLVWHGSEVLDRAEAAGIAAYLDAPRRVHGVELRASVTRADPDTGGKVKVGERPVSVWHCSLSLPTGDAPLGDDRWAAVARDFAEAMGLTATEDRAATRWVAVHHGASKKGNDHIHLVASMVREDGSRWDGRWGSKKAAQDACRDLETRHGLTRVTGPEREVVERGITPGEHRRAVAAGLDPATAGPRDLAARVRKSALASTSEAEFVRRARAEGVVVKPRFADKTKSKIVGYSVAERPGPGSGEWVFYSGGELGRDMTLPKLREAWGRPSVEDDAAAVAEWRAAHAGKPAVAPGRETVALDRGAPAVAAQRLGAFNDRLATLSHTDRAGWADAARQASALTVAWAAHQPEHAAELTRAAGVLARSAQARRPGRVAVAPSRDSGMAAALVLSARAGGLAGGQVEMLGREIARTATALRDHHTALGHAEQAAHIHTGVLARFRPVLAAAAAAGRAARAAERIVDPGLHRESEGLGRWPDLDMGR